MKKTNKKNDRYLIAAITLILFLLMVARIKTQSAWKVYYPPHEIYENASGFSLNKSDLKNSTSYGDPIGTFLINGETGRETQINNTKAYTVEGTMTFGYNCKPEEYQTETKDNWNLVSCDEKTVGEVSLSKKVSNGVMIIQKSFDGMSWEDACDPLYNFFKNNKVNYNSIYTTTEEEIKRGTFYRVIVAYEMRKKTGTQKKLFGFKEDIFELKYCVEKYDFYLCYAKNPISIRDLTTRTVVANDGTVSDGFMIDDNGANATITIKRDINAPQSAVAFQSYTTPGLYTVSVTSPVGDSFQIVVKVSGGLSTHTIPVVHYENSEKTGYTVEKRAGGDVSLTSLMIGQKAGTTIKNARVNGFDAYGITGDSVNLYMRLMAETEYEKSGWEIITDDWGKKEKQTIEGVWTGAIESGALIVQKSNNGIEWKQIDSGRYANGLYTTDFYNNYSGRGDILIYSPDGKEVIKGVYIRILYAYEIKQKDGRQKKRCIDEYIFYLCSDELGAVTFHNLTAKDQVKEICGNDNEIELSMYETAETMLPGSITVTGFKIDTSLNPTVTYTVKRNGINITSESGEYNETGEYDIELKSVVGSVTHTTLYVDKMTTDEMFSVYFGDGFIDGKRIFSEGQYPTYEGGYTKYVLNSVSSNYQPLYGEISNITTGKTTKIAASRAGRSVALSEPGEYVVTLNNNPTYDSETPSGDNKVITFHFNIIAEGTAPGPKVNRQSLEDSMRSSLSGTYPKYYGLIYSSAAAGNITLAFKNREEAFQYAYNYEKGTVEEQKDGTYLYTGSFVVGQKTRFDSNWDLTDALNYFADQAIHEMYFDLSDEAYYLTLDDSVLEKTKNPRTLELKRSVTIFADGQEELLTDIEALPILNSHPFAYLTPGVNGTTKSGVADYEFVRDKYGCDSNSVEITDAAGMVYEIDYDKNVDEQLAESGCVTGKVTVTEQTIYGDKTSYDAVYFANGENTAKLTLSYYEDGEEKSAIITQANNDEIYEVDAFSIEDVSDEIDPYDLVIVKDESGRTYSYVADQVIDGAWSDHGDYEVSVVNRIGNKYSFVVSIGTSEYATISFQGEGIGDFRSIIVKRDDKNVSLPVPERYGYEFSGYTDDQGTMFEDVIDQITFSGAKVLTPLWNPKKYNVILNDNDGNEIKTISVDFGKYADIPNPDVPDGYIFDGWFRDGEELEDNKVKITEENDVVLVALFRPDSSVQDDVEPTIDTNENEDKKPFDISTLILVFSLTFISILFLSVLVIFISKKMSVKNKVDEGSDDKEDEKIVGKADIVATGDKERSNNVGDFENEK